MVEKQICTICATDSDVPGVLFDQQGVCNYCHLYATIEKDWPQGEEGQAKLNELIEEIKQAGEGNEYDCVVGLSGGTDSTYLLYLAKQWGLRPLAVHFDNGWNSPIAVRNIKKAVDKLDIDLETYVVDWEEYKDILLAFLRASFPWADAPTDLAINATLYRIAEEENIGFILNGSSFRTEGKMPTEWTYLDARMVKYIHGKYGKKKLASYPNLTVLDFFRYSMIKRIRLVRPLNFMDYHKDKAREKLEKELDWQYYGGHHFENVYTRFVYSYLLPEKFKIDKRIITHSALVRAGELTREEALAELGQLSYPPDKVEEDVEFVRNKLELSIEEFENIIKTPPKTFRDFPSYYPFIERFSPIIRIFFRVALSWTPPFFLEMDARKS